jgi:hypothetical protein
LAPGWPENLYGATKVGVERPYHYYHVKHGLDYRRLRFPLIVKDVIEGILGFRDVPEGKLTHRVYNLHGIAPTAEDIALAIAARGRLGSPTASRWSVPAPGPAGPPSDWGWNPGFGRGEMANDLLAELRAR